MTDSEDNKNQSNTKPEDEDVDWNNALEEEEFEITKGEKENNSDKEIKLGE